MFPFTFTRRSSLLIRCDPPLLYDLLVDYDNYIEWMPLVARSKLLAKEGDLAIAEFELLEPAKDTFVVECVHTRNKMVMWRPIRGKIPISEARCDIEPAGKGQTRVTMTLEGDWGWRHLFRSPYNRFINPVACLRALHAEASVFQPEMIADEDGERILEISETSEGLICWLRGKKYVLTPVSGGSHGREL